MHVAISDLSPHLRSALKSVGYGAQDIRVEAAYSVEVSEAGGAGQRGFCFAVNLDTGARAGGYGSWGGANIFNPTNAVDLSPDKFEIPVNGAVIKGTTGYPRTFCTIYAHPDAMGKFLPSGEEETLSYEEGNALYCFTAIKGGAYRRDELARRNVSAATIDGLVERGYLKRNRAGACQVTTKGKNAARDGH